MADKFKPNIIKQLESKNKLTIIANHYGKNDMRFENLKIPKIEFSNITGEEADSCLTTLKQDSPFLKYEYFNPADESDPINIKLIYIAPKVFDKRIGPRTIKYISLCYFNMIGTIQMADLKEIDKLAYTF